MIQASEHRRERRALVVGGVIERVSRSMYELVHEGALEFFHDALRVFAASKPPLRPLELMTARALSRIA